MNVWQHWLRRPQNLWFRKALFQIHLWVGIGIGLYIVLISVSGSAIVFRPQLVSKFDRPPITVTVSGTKMTPDELAQRAQQDYSGFKVDAIRISKRPERPTTILLNRGNTEISREFNPYTGQDMGDPISRTVHFVDWLVDFHDNLGSHRTGRFWNGVGAIVVTLTSLAGIILWWPGIKNWRRSAFISWKVRFPLFNWRLHSVIGLWCSVWVLLWGLSGIYFTFPDPFIAALGDSSRFVDWIVRLHFGRFGRVGRATPLQLSLSMLWVILGLAPAVLTATGFLMWWNRVLRRRLFSTGGRESADGRLKKSKELPRPDTNVGLLS
jgi:uncharacterized iron-regulated membrane protein